MINKSDLKVGVFVLMGLTLGALVVFLIGGERRVFETAVDFKTAFDDVGGLKPGAPVNMGGVRIGKVESVEYSEEAEDTRVHVVLEVVKDEAVRIRGGWHDVKGKQVWKGTKALVTPKGLLGDMQVELTKGEGEQLAA